FVQRTPDTVRSIDDCTTAFKPRCLVQSSSENDRRGVSQKLGISRQIDRAPECEAPLSAIV
ncbi:hypothetical protein ABTD85_23835, partial [Acinetobacter baumannii]